MPLIFTNLSKSLTAYPLFLLFVGYALSTKEPIHVVLKARRLQLRHKSFRTPQKFEREGLLAANIAKKANSRIMTDTSKNSDAGPKYAKRAVKNLWKYWPFTRVVRGWKAYQVVRNYIQLNEKEI